MPNHASTGSCPTVSFGTAGMAAHALKSRLARSDALARFDAALLVHVAWGEAKARNGTARYPCAPRPKQKGPVSLQALDFLVAGVRNPTPDALAYQVIRRGASSDAADGHVLMPHQVLAVKA